MGRTRSFAWHKPLLLLFSLLLAELLLQTAGLVYALLGQRSRGDPSDSSQGLRIVCLGESTTALGLGDSYPNLLQKELAERLPGTPVRVANLGKSGTNSKRILEELDAILQRHKPHFVITMIGINDRWEEDEEKRTMFGGLLDRIKLLKLAKLMAVNLKHRRKRPVVRKEPAAELMPEALPQAEPAVKGSKHYSIAENKFRQRTEEGYREAIQYYLRDLETAKKPRPRTYFKIARSFASIGDYEGAETYFGRYAKAVPGAASHGEIGEFYFFEQRNDTRSLANAIRHLETAYALDPGSTRTLIVLGEAYAFSEKSRDKAIRFLRAAVDRGIATQRGYNYLGRLYFEAQRIDDAESTFEKGLDSPSPISRQLWSAYITWEAKLGRWEKAAEIIRRFQKKYGDYPNIERSTLELKDSAGNAFYAFAGVPLESTQWCGSSTERNYKEILRRIRAFGATPVVVQYPTLDDSELRRWFGKDAIIVSNQDNFEEALGKSGYDALFWDRFGGTFGHFNRLGAQILAHRVASRLLESGLLRGDSGVRGGSKRS